MLVGSAAIPQRRFNPRAWKWTSNEPTGQGETSRLGEKNAAKIWVLNQKIGEKNPKWMEFRIENPIKMDDLGVPPFSETPIYPP